MGKVNTDELEHVAEAIWVKFFQSKPDKLNAARQCAQIAIQAHWGWGDEKQVWTEPDEDQAVFMMDALQRWHNR